MLEGANIKLSSKLTHINGKGSRQFLDLLLSGEDISLESVDDIRNKNMHSTAEEILNSLDGIVSELQKKLLRSVLDHIDDMTRRIKDVDKIIKDYIKDYEDAIKAVDEIPGVGKIGAQTILSEIGKDMSRFPTAAHLCKWAGVAPGNNQSAGKSRSGRTTKGNATLKTTLIQCAHGASKHKGTFFYAQYHTSTHPAERRVFLLPCFCGYLFVFIVNKNNEKLPQAKCSQQFVFMGIGFK